MEPLPSRSGERCESGGPQYLYFQRLDSVTGYNNYEGTIGTWYSHKDAPGNLCNANVTDLGNGEMLAEITPSAGDRYYLITAYRDLDEGPSGFDSDGIEIPAKDSSCAP
jgi:hypothetical protein